MNGTVTLAGGPATPGRVDIFLQHQENGTWTYRFPDDPYASGPSPLAFDFDATPLAGQPLALYVFTSHALREPTGTAGASVAPPVDFTVEGTVLALPQ